MVNGAVGLCFVVFGGRCWSLGVVVGANGLVSGFSLVGTRFGAVCSGVDVAWVWLLFALPRREVSFWNRVGGVGVNGLASGLSLSLIGAKFGSGCSGVGVGTKWVLLLFALSGREESLWNSVARHGGLVSRYLGLVGVAACPSSSSTGQILAL
jgi:hypothetical protein